MIKGAIFDLGSTLIAFQGSWPDILEDSTRALIQSLQASGVEFEAAALHDAFHQANERYQRQRQIDHLERSTAFVLGQVFAAQNVPEPSAAVLRQALRTMYAVSEAHWQRLPEAAPVLQALRRQGLRLGLLSNAGDAENVDRLIDQAELRSYFDPIVVSAAIGIRKPDPRAFAPILDAWRVHASEVVMVGDTLGEDILGAQACGLHQIWVRSLADPQGVATFEGIVRPEATAERLDQVPAAIDRMNGVPR
ncbi:MAG: HAD family hydrolase [Anaerolineales bacterium]|nr:HAD family hydrolase [Anaerolineales bacterium]